MTIALVIICMFALLAFVSFYGSSEEKDDREERRGWRLRYYGESYRYEEKQDGEWQHINFEVVRQGHGIHGIRIKSRASWISYPKWALHRREEIVSRMKEELSQLRFYTETEPNQSPETTICTVTDRAPSSTLRASADRVSP